MQENITYNKNTIPYNEIIQVQGYSKNPVAIKQTQDCVVLDSGECIIKIREIDNSDPQLVFEDIILHAFAQEYKKMGISWDISCVNHEGRTYRIEKREKLHVLQESELSFEEILEKSYSLKLRVEKKLGFPRLLSYIRGNENFEHVRKFILMRDAKNDFSDYALYGNEIVFLGESKWFIAPVDYKGEWIDSLNGQIVPVDVGYGKYFFARYNSFKSKHSSGETRVATSKAFEISPKWWLYDSVSGDIESAFNGLQDEYESLLSINAKLLTTKVKKDIKTEESLSDMATQCKWWLDTGYVERDVKDETLGYDKRSRGGREHER